MKSFLFTAILSLQKRSEQFLIKFAILLQVRLTHAQTFFRGINVSTLVLMLCAPQSLFAYARSKWPTRKSSIKESSTSKANPSIAGRQNRLNQPGNRKEYFAKRYATKMYLNDAIGR